VREAAGSGNGSPTALVSHSLYDRRGAYHPQLPRLFG